MNNSIESDFIKRIDIGQWKQSSPRLDWADDLEAGRILHFEKLPFSVANSEQLLFNPAIQKKGVRNISLSNNGTLKGADLGVQDQITLTQFILRYRVLAQNLIETAFPKYTEHLRIAPTSFRPNQVETRTQSIRADDKRLHIDAFPTRPNNGERILRVFMNVNLAGKPRVWRIGEPFADIANYFVPKIKQYSKFQASILNALRITKSLRSEYDHLMLGIHDGMKMDDKYQENCNQLTYGFAPGSVWVCYSDQTAHAVMSGQYMMEQTYHLPIHALYSPEKSPLAVLQKLTKKSLI